MWTWHLLETPAQDVRYALEVPFTLNHSDPSDPSLEKLLLF